MEAKLVVAKGKTAVKEIPLGNVQTIIGRRNDCALRIPSPLVSRQHCELKCSGSQLLVRDLGSSNGTFVNGSKIKQKELKSGDTLGVGPITFIVKLGEEALSPSDTARPVRAAAVADVADFVVGEEVDDNAEADFVVGAEVVADEAGTDDADFVVAEESGSDDASDFVVAEATDDTAAADLADFVASSEPAAEGDSDFVVAEVSDESETVLNLNAKDVAKKKAAKADEPAVEESGEESDSTDKKPEKAKAKPGLFGRLFKRKPKESKEKSAPAPSKQDKPTAAPAAKAPAEKAPASPAAKTAAEPDVPDFFVAEDEESATASKPVGEDELADFLMGLNEKDQ